jgi:hypothetical protein
MRAHGVRHRFVRVAEDGDEAHAQRRRHRSRASSVPAIVRTTMIPLRPWSFDSPLARARISTGISSTLSPDLVQPQDRLNLRRLGAAGHCPRPWPAR